MYVLFIAPSMVLIGCAIWLWQVSRAHLVQVAVSTEAKPIAVLVPSSEESVSHRALPGEEEEEAEGQARGIELPGDLRGAPLKVRDEDALWGPGRSENKGHANIKTLTCIGEALLPKQVYVGDSQNISLSAQVISSKRTALPEQFFFSETEQGKHIHLRVQGSESEELGLEVELLAAGITTDGDKRQLQMLGAKRLIYRWSCYFPNPGDQTLMLILRAVNGSERQELGTLQHKVKVMRLAHLSQRQTELCAALSGVASFISTALGIAVILRLI